ncbi:MAG: hypothetical protein KC646_00520 [Candidatus Cloacimonetes bacterium]|nr:hypothetical protein [Candidatus Cloacimonadota bacterium]
MTHSQLLDYSNNDDFPSSTLNSASTSIFKDIHKAIYLNVKDFGAVGDGLVDDTKSIQNLINTLIGSSVYNGVGSYGGGTIFLPKGTYLLSRPLELYSKINLIGEDETATNLLVSKAFVGDAIVLLQSIPNQPNHNQGCEIANIEFDSRGTAKLIAAVRVDSSVGVVNNLAINNIILATQYGFILDGYTQKLVIDKVYSHGSIEQIVKLVGNDNIIQNIDKEAATGNKTTEPYIHIKDASNLRLRDILIEGAGSLKKAYIKIISSNNIIIDDYWSEMNQSNGYILDVENSKNVVVRGEMSPTAPYRKIKIAKTMGIDFSFASSDGQNAPFLDMFDIDEVSLVSFDKIESRRGSDLYPLDKMPNITIKSHINSSLYSGDYRGFASKSMVNFQGGHNLLTNPSFEAGRFNWIFSGSLGAPDSQSFVPSEVAPGLMANFGWNTSGSTVIYQSYEVPANQVGRALTFSMLMKIVSGGSAFMWIRGAGLPTVNNMVGTSQGSGWQMFNQTIVPQAAGTLYLGFTFTNPGQIYLDEASLAFGTVGSRNTAKYVSMELGPQGGNTLTYGDQAPLSGTWKKADIMYNKLPIPGSYVGWVCTEAGTPGVWKGFGLISN